MSNNENDNAANDLEMTNNEEKFENIFGGKEEVYKANEKIHDNNKIHNEKLRKKRSKNNKEIANNIYDPNNTYSNEKGMERNDITDFGNQNKNNIDKNIINNNNSEKRPSHNNHDINDKSDDISFSKEDIKNKIDNNNENTSGRDINNLTTKPNECNNIYCLNCIC